MTVGRVSATLLHPQNPLLRPFLATPLAQHITIINDISITNWQVFLTTFTVSKVEYTIFAFLETHICQFSRIHSISGISLLMLPIHLPSITVLQFL